MEFRDYLGIIYSVFLKSCCLPFENCCHYYSTPKWGWLVFVRMVSPIKDCFTLVSQRYWPLTMLVRVKSGRQWPHMKLCLHVQHLLPKPFSPTNGHQGQPVTCTGGQYWNIWTQQLGSRHLGNPSCLLPSPSKHPPLLLAKSGLQFCLVQHISRHLNISWPGGPDFVA